MLPGYMDHLLPDGRSKILAHHTHFINDKPNGSCRIYLRDKTLTCQFQDKAKVQRGSGKLIFRRQVNARLTPVWIQATCHRKLGFVCSVKMAHYYASVVRFTL